MGHYKSPQEAANAFNLGVKIKATVTVGMWKKGAEIIINPGSAIVSGQYVNVITANGSTYNLALNQFEGGAVTKEELHSQIGIRKSEIVVLESKLEYLTKTGQDNFDDTEFKVWNTLQVIKGKKSDLEKSKAIAALINS